MTNWQIMLSNCIPVFLTVETTGVNSDDSVSAVSLRPPVTNVPALLFFDVADDASARAAKFMNMDETAFMQAKKSTPSTLEAILVPTFEHAADSNMTAVVVTYNTVFQRRFVQSLVPGLVTSLHWLDICKLCWCIDNVKASALDCDDLGEFITRLDEFTVGAKKMGYKDTMTAWGVPLPQPCSPQQKTEHVEWLWNKISNWSEGAQPYQLPYRVSAFPEIAPLCRVKT